MHIISLHCLLLVKLEDICKFTNPIRYKVKTQYEVEFFGNRKRDKLKLLYMLEISWKLDTFSIQQEIFSSSRVQFVQRRPEHRAVLSKSVLLQTGRVAQMLFSVSGDDSKEDDQILRNLVLFFNFLRIGLKFVYPTSLNPF